jgi:hypothetical protein
MLALCPFEKVWIPFLEKKFALICFLLICFEFACEISTFGSKDLIFKFEFRREKISNFEFEFLAGKFEFELLAGKFEFEFWAGKFEFWRSFSNSNLVLNLSTAIFNNLTRL